MTTPDVPYRTTILGGRVDVGATGIRIVGVLWLMAAVAMAVAAIRVFRNSDNALPVAWAAVAFSGIMTIVGWPATQPGTTVRRRFPSGWFAAR